MDRDSPLEILCEIIYGSWNTTKPWMTHRKQLIWFDFFSYIVKKNTLPSQRKTLRQCLWLGRNVVQAVRVVATLTSLRKNYNVAPMLPRCWIVSSCPNIPWMLYWQRCCNVEISTSNLQPLLNIDLTTSDLRGNVASTSDSGFSSQ